MLRTYVFYIDEMHLDKQRNSGHKSLWLLFVMENPLVIYSVFEDTLKLDLGQFTPMTAETVKKIVLGMQKAISAI